MLLGTTESGGRNGGGKFLREALASVPDLYGQAGPPLRTATSQDLSAVLCAHPLTKSMFTFLLEVRWLLKCKRHTITPGLKDSRITGYYRDGLATLSNGVPPSWQEDPGMTVA